MCGFMNGLSTDIPIAKLLKHVFEGAGANKDGTCVFLYLKKKTFDMVHAYFIKGMYLELLCSHLQNRQQYVSNNNAK